jgi:hypothetical protein
MLIRFDPHGCVQNVELSRFYHAIDDKGTVEPFGRLISYPSDWSMSEIDIFRQLTNGLPSHAVVQVEIRAGFRQGVTYQDS